MLMLLTAISTVASVVSAVCALVSVLRRPGRANTSHVARTGVLRRGQLRPGGSELGPDPHQGFKEARRPRARVQPGRVADVRRGAKKGNFDDFLSRVTEIGLGDREVMLFRDEKHDQLVIELSCREGVGRWLCSDGAYLQDPQGLGCRDAVSARPFCEDNQAGARPLA